MGIETTGASTTARNIDVRNYDVMQTLLGNSGWTGWAPQYGEYPAGVGYQASNIGGNFDVYLPPWD